MNSIILSCLRIVFLMVVHDNKKSKLTDFVFVMFDGLYCKKRKHTIFADLLKIKLLRLVAKICSHKNYPDLGFR